MTPIVYVNGEYLPRDDARIHIDDRGFQFADGVYEVCLVIGGQYWDAKAHLDRFDKSLAALRIAPPLPRVVLQGVMADILRRNHLQDALVYIQATRGVAPRNHAFPTDNVPSSLIITARPFDLNESDAAATKGGAVITMPDIRWGRVDIKSISLLPNVLAKQAAVEAGAIEAWLTRDQKVTEGASSNAWIVDDDGVLFTHPLGHEILGGVTRLTVISCAYAKGLSVQEIPFTVDMAKKAKEAFITAATTLVMPVTSIDGNIVGDGNPGEITQKLRQAYKDSVSATNT